MNQTCCHLSRLLFHEDNTALLRLHTAVCMPFAPDSQRQVGSNTRSLNPGSSPHGAVPCRQPRPTSLHRKSGLSFPTIARPGSSHAALSCIKAAWASARPLLAGKIGRTRFWREGHESTSGSSHVHGSGGMCL